MEFRLPKGNEESAASLSCGGKRFNVPLLQDETLTGRSSDLFRSNLKRAVHVVPQRLLLKINTFQYTSLVVAKAVVKFSCV